MIQIKTFSPESHKVKALIYGAPGSGKTVFGGTAPKPIFASAEGGLLSIADKKPAFVDIKSLKDLQDLLLFLKNEKHDYETVVIDSISEINDIIKSEIERRSKRTMQIQDWGELSRKIKGILRGFRDLPMHVLFVAHEMPEKDGDKVIKIVPLLNGKAATEIAGFMDIVAYIGIEKDGSRTVFTDSSQKYVTKARYDKISEGCELNFTAWIKKISNLDISEQEVMTEYEGVEERKQKLDGSMLKIGTHIKQEVVEVEEDDLALPPNPSLK